MPPARSLTPELAMEIALDALREAGLDEQAQYLEHHELIKTAVRVETMEAEYGDAYCSACSMYGGDHDADCFVLHTWKFLDDPRYAAHQEMMRLRLEREERARREREEWERNRCQVTSETGRCRNPTGHKGAHNFPLPARGLNDMLRELYAPMARREESSVILNPRDYSVLVRELGAAPAEPEAGMQQMRFSGIDVLASPLVSPGNIIMGQSPIRWDQMISRNPQESMREAVARVINPPNLFGVDREADTVMLTGIRYEENDE